MSREAQALHDLMPVIHKIVNAIRLGAQDDERGVYIALMDAANSFMDIPSSSLVVSLYREWLRCQEEPK